MTTTNKRGRKPISKDTLLKDIQKVAAELKQDYLGLNWYNKYGLYSVGVYERNFGTWNNAVAMAGLKPFAKYTEEELLADLIRVATELKTTKLSLSSYKANGKYAPNTYSYRFGKWSAALKKAGLA